MGSGDTLESVMKELLKKAVEAAVSEMLEGAEHQFDVSVEYPKDFRFGDYATSVALAIGKKIGKNPMDVAQELYKDMALPDGVTAIITAPGYVNFSLDASVLVANIGRILSEKDAYGKGDVLAGQKVMIEYTDPNPFKVFHIGHLMTNVIGESLSRLLAFHGAEVKRANYQGDVGLHVAKTLWGILHAEEKFPSDDEPLDRRVEFLGTAYASGAAHYESDEDVKKEIVKINRKVYERSDEKINALYDKGRTWSLEHFETIYAKLGTRFDYYFFESQTAPQGLAIVQKHLAGGVFEKSDGAVIFPGEKEGLHNRVFITSEGFPTYESKDLGLAHIKYATYPYDRSLIVTASEQAAYFAVMLAALKRVAPQLAERTAHIDHGMLRLAHGKMSSRTGNVISGEAMLSDAIARSHEKIKGDGFTEEEKTAIAHRVGVAALKYAILKQAIGKDIIYDADRAFSLEGDSGPYLQYAYVRTCSILQKAAEEKIAPSCARAEEASCELERILQRFPDVAARAAQQYAPQQVVSYLITLAQAFNAYYATQKIVEKGNPSSPYRVALTEAVGHVLKNGLFLLGIEVTEKM